MEDKLWQAMQGLEETAMMLQHIGEHIKDAGDAQIADDFLKKANEVAERARIVHDSVFKHERLNADLKYKKDKDKDKN